MSADVLLTLNAGSSTVKVGLFEAGDEAQCGGFSATAFADDDEKFAAVDIEISLIDSGYRTKSFREPA